MLILSEISTTTVPRRNVLSHARGVDGVHGRSPARQRCPQHADDDEAVFGSRSRPGVGAVHEATCLHRHGRAGRRVNPVSLGRRRVKGRYRFGPSVRPFISARPGQSLVPIRRKTKRRRKESEKWIVQTSNPNQSRLFPVFVFSFLLLLFVSKKKGSRSYPEKFQVAASKTSNAHCASSASLDEVLIDIDVCEKKNGKKIIRYLRGRADERKKTCKKTKK